MRHHYVPEFLQKPWAENSPDGKLMVFRLDIQGIPSKPHTPKHTGFDHDLYALTQEKVAGMEKQAVEKNFLRIIDNNAARVRVKLEKYGLKSLEIEDKMDWARFLMSLRLRQPDIVEMLKRESAQHLKATLNDQPEEYEELAAPEDAPTLEEWTDWIFELDFQFMHQDYYWKKTACLYDNPQFQDINTFRLFVHTFCPVNCAYCTLTGLQRAATGKPTKAVGLVGVDTVKIIKRVLEKYPDTHQIFFADDDFMLTPQW